MSLGTGSPVQRHSLAGSHVVTPDAVLADAQVHVDGDRIVEVEGRRRLQTVPDSETPDRIVLPGFVDLHGDDIERQVFPRPNARVDLDTALFACDRATVSAGITTKFHAVAFENHPSENRSVELATDVVDAVDRAEETLVDHRVNARCELGDPGVVGAVCDVLDRSVVDLVSLMNHVPGDGQFEGAEAFARRYAEDGGQGSAAVDRLLEQRRPVPPDSDPIERVTRNAKRAGIPVASHDDEDPRTVERRHERGVEICEYPTTIEAARRAVELGMRTAMGAPNLVRGGSLWGNLSARAAVSEGLVSALCSDYHPPSLLSALFVDTGEPLPDRVARLTERPAEAVGLTDRGRIEPGARADLVVVDPTPVPTVERAVVGGDVVFQA